VKVVPIPECPPHAEAQGLADGTLAGARNAHQDYNRCRNFR
jgi:hypothetical protein